MSLTSPGPKTRAGQKEKDHGIEEKAGHKTEDG